MPISFSTFFKQYLRFMPNSLQHVLSLSYNLHFMSVAFHVIFWSMPDKLSLWVLFLSKCVHKMSFNVQTVLKFYLLHFMWEWI